MVLLTAFLLYAFAIGDVMRDQIHVWRVVWGVYVWTEGLYGHASHQPETVDYGIESFVYRARVPCDPAKLHACLTVGGLYHVLRTEGHFWLATRPDRVGGLAVAGSQTMTARMGRWRSAVPKHH